MAAAAPCSSWSLSLRGRGGGGLPPTGFACPELECQVTRLGTFVHERSTGVLCSIVPAPNGKPMAHAPAVDTSHPSVPDPSTRTPSSYTVNAE